MSWLRHYRSHSTLRFSTAHTGKWKHPLLRGGDAVRVDVLWPISCVLEEAITAFVGKRHGGLGSGIHLHLGSTITWSSSTSWKLVQCLSDLASAVCRPVGHRKWERQAHTGPRASLAGFGFNHHQYPAQPVVMCSGSGKPVWFMVHRQGKGTLASLALSWAIMTNDSPDRQN